MSLLKAIDTEEAAEREHVHGTVNLRSISHWWRRMAVIIPGPVSQHN